MNIYEKVLKIKGAECQKKKALEEMAELQVAMLHNSDGKATDLDVVNEIADVINTMEEMKLIYDKDHMCEQIRMKKLMRLAKSLKV